MKIAIDARSLLPEQLTGIGNVAENISLAVMKSYPDEEYIYSYFAATGRKQKRERIKRMCLNERVKLKVCPYFSSRLYKIASTFLYIPHRMFFGGADITHFYNFILPPGVKGKRVCTIHDLAFLHYPETVSFLTRKMLTLNLKKTVKRADGIIAVSQYTADDIVKYYGVPREKIKVIYPGIDSEKFKPMPKESVLPVMEKHGLDYKNYLLYLGTIEPRKNLASLIRGYALTAKKLSSEGKFVPKLILAGKLGWYYDEILKTAEAEGVSDSVKFLGYVDNSDKAALYCGARAFVFPSLFEGFGIPVIEAMACGAPVLTSRSSSLTEIAEGSAVTVDLDCSDKNISNGLYTLCTDDGFCNRLSDVGIENAKRFTWERAGEETYAYYRKIAEVK